MSNEPDFNRIKWAPGVTMTSDDVRGTIGAIDAISGAGRRPLLVHIGSVERITREARELLIADTCSSKTAVLGMDQVSMVMTAFAYTSATPTQFFTEESEAIAWLLESPDNADNKTSCMLAASVHTGDGEVQSASDSHQSGPAI